MAVARRLYHQPIVEVLLLVCVLSQVTSGLCLIIQRWNQRRGWVAWLQAISGAMLAFFLLVHVVAVVYGRAVLNLDTNFYFAAAGFHVPPNQFFFGPYYFFAVLALFIHLGCAVYWCFDNLSPETRRLVIAIPVLVGCAVSLLIVLSLAGKLNQLKYLRHTRPHMRTRRARFGSKDVRIEECDVPLLRLLDRDLIKAAFFHDSYRAPLIRTQTSAVKTFFAVFGITRNG
jgi:succinate dehydrogenase/fumarate reductase cytochrome b subunit